ncbi:MAG TPA: hypothetical protein VHB77_13650, partial [Planctomycetaceae bacterium]|nr:hypothetical protein [Planctomycetaceae bacterium]
NEWFARSSHNATLRAIEAAMGATDPAHNLTASPSLVRGCACRQTEYSVHTRIVQLRWPSPFTAYQIDVLISSDGSILAVSTSGVDRLRPKQSEVEAASRVIHNPPPPPMQAPRPPRQRRRPRQVYVAQASPSLDSLSRRRPRACDWL